MIRDVILLYVCDAAIRVFRCYFVFFFFSSRRRHTRLVSDWSSDVCSSDLATDYREDNHIDLKNDIKISSNSNLALTFTRGRPFQNAASITTVVDPDWTSPLQARNSRGTASFVIGGASWTSESRYGANWSNTDRLTCCFHLIDPMNPKEEFAYGRRLGRISTNLGFNTPASEIVILRGPTQVLSEKFSKQLRQHSLKFGAQYSTHCCQRANVEAVGWTYTGLPDLLANIASNINVSFGQGEYSARLSEWGVFIQDDWRIHPRLTLNLGLRYDFFGHMIATPKDAAGSFLVNPDGLNISNMTVGPIRPQKEAMRATLLTSVPDLASRTTWMETVRLLYEEAWACSSVPRSWLHSGPVCTP